MKLRPATKEAFQLLMEGSQAMAEVEANGLRIDVKYLDSMISKVQTEIGEMETKLRSSKEYKLWAKHYGNSMTFGSKVQLGHVMFDLLKHRRNPKSGNQNDVVAFEHLKSDFIKNYFDIERMKKALSTYLLGIKLETVDGFCHPFFNIHTAESYRSSSSNVNFQNIPVRNKRIAEIIRSCVVPRKGRVFIEIDFSSHEVRISCCYHKDPKLIDYVKGGGDMHKDMAQRLYMLEGQPEEFWKKGFGKPARDMAKNKFVFAEFYGSYYAQCAPDLWDAISFMDLRGPEGQTMYEHLASRGIKKLGKCVTGEEPAPNTFEYKVREVERFLWEDTFTVYNQWRKDWWAKYQTQGGINFLTGFKQEGVFRRNQILCDCIQGSAFHCLLWTVIESLRMVKKKKMKSLLVCQIHDSMLWDTVPEEIPELIGIIKETAEVKILKHWDWIIVPLQVEVEIARENWYVKRKMEAV